VGERGDRAGWETLMASKPIVLQSITRAKFEAVCAKIETQGQINLTGDTGSASGHGFEASWSYSEPDQTLTVVINKAPFGFEGLAADKLTALVESA
jgi:hypothetical protein